VVTPEGGVLELDDGARLIVPGSSLTAETEITLTRECGGVYKSAAFESCVYGVEGSADTLAGGVTLVLPGVANANSRAMVQTDDGFRALAKGSALHEISSEGNLSISRFGAYARMRSLENVDDARCSGLSFEPCGGDPVGDWELVCSTGTYKQLLGSSWSGPDPYATCLPNHVLHEHPYDVTGGMKVGLGECDENAAQGCKGPLQISRGGTIWRRTLLTEECLATVGETCNSDCTLADGVCDCLFERFKGGGASIDFWHQVNETTASFGPYCVNGDTLIIENDHPEGTYTSLYRRKTP
jgi:hypothetical protein